MNTQDRSIRKRSAWHSVAIGGALAGVLAAPAWLFAGPAPAVTRQTAALEVAAKADGVAPRIEIAHHTFSQPTITVPVGTTVTWVNRDEDIHTIVSTAQVFTSSALDSGDAYSYTFTKPGVYRYFCTLHPLMTGSVIVR